MRAVKMVFALLLLSLATTAFADVFPQNPPPDLALTDMFYTGATLGATVESITDFNGSTFIGTLDFLADMNQFTVWDPSTSDVYLQGNYVTQGALPGNEYGLIYTVTLDNNALWSAIEGTTASSFGSLIAIDIHNLDISITDGSIQPGASADLAPLGAVPEPATLTLLAAGLAGGLLRKKLATK